MRGMLVVLLACSIPAFAQADDPPALRPKTLVEVESAIVAAQKEIARLDVGALGLESHDRELIELFKNMVIDGLGIALDNTLHLKSGSRSLHSAVAVSQMLAMVRIASRDLAAALKRVGERAESQAAVDAAKPIAAMYRSFNDPARNFDDDVRALASEAD